MKILETSLKDVYIIEPKVYGDSRGFFFESYNAEAYRPVLGDACFVQDNHSRSARGVLRGLHYQIQNTQAKLVRVVRGAVFDIAVDLRRSSSTFGKWMGIELSEDNHRQLWIPEGFAHGFLVLSETADFLYKATATYAPAHERCILWNDPDLAIAWPLEGPPVLSEKDKMGVAFKEAPMFA